MRADVGALAALFHALVTLGVATDVVAQPPQTSPARLLGLLQLRLERSSADGAAVTLDIPRARVGVTGSVIDPDLRYLVVAELAGDGARLFVANVDYALGDGGAIVRLGRFKRPLSRSFLTSAGALSLVDRPLTVGPGLTGDDVDLGAAVQDDGRGLLEYAAGVFRGATDRIRPALVARLGYRARDLRGYSEGDLEGGGLRVGVAVAGLLDLGAGDDDRPLASGILDVLVKAHGVWSRIPVPVMGGSIPAASTPSHEALPVVGMR